MNVKSVFIIVPVFNEAQVLPEVIRSLREKFQNIVVVDDASSDDSNSIAKREGATVLRHMINLGQGAALQTGIDYCLENGAEYIITFDGDAQHSTEDLEKLLDPLFRGEADFALGSRFLGETEGMPRSRSLLLKLALWFTRVTSGLAITDTHNGLRAFSANAAHHLNISFNRMAHASQILEQIGESGLRYCEIPVTIRYTNYSLSKGQRNRAIFSVLWEYWSGKLLK